MLSDHVGSRGWSGLSGQHSRPLGLSVTGHCPGQCILPSLRWKVFGFRLLCPRRCLGARAEPGFDVWKDWPCPDYGSVVFHTALPEDHRDVQTHLGLCRLRCKSWLSNCMLFKSSLCSICLQYPFLTFTCTLQAE